MLNPIQTLAILNPKWPVCDFEKQRLRQDSVLNL